MSARALRPLEVVLVESYHGGSHRAWAEGYATSSANRVRLVTHPDRFWRWRMRGSSVTLAEQVIASVEADGPADVLLFSSMVNVPEVLGYTRRHVEQPAVVLYLHENQLVHPLGPRQRFDEGLALVTWKSMVAADAVVFNSEFHRAALLAALESFLGRFPDEGHLRLLEPVAARSCVRPVGVEAIRLSMAARVDDGGPPLVLWNQRWDHDKNPTAVFRALVRLADDGVAFRLALAGENSRLRPSEFDWVRDRLGERVVGIGYCDRVSYLDLLRRTDVVVSASRHEFFGVAIVEAMAAGAVPVLPDRLSYPELVPEALRPVVLYPEGELGRALRRALTNLPAVRASIAGLRREMERFDWSVVAPGYDSLLAATVESAERAVG